MIIAWILILCILKLVSGQNVPPPISQEHPIRIALALDRGSLQEILVVIESVTSVSLHPEHIVFHIVFVGASMKEAEAFEKETMTHIRECFPDLNIEALAFSFPRDSGFIKQVKKDNSGSGWVSPLATDMVRFHVASFFPNVPRLLYLDNDVVVTCCLEDVWMSELKEGTVLGVVVDHIPWSVTTQFAQHYNATHPLVMKAILRGRPPSNPHRVTLDDFNQLMKGKYPNDGVLLIDVSAFNAINILPEMEALAMVNSPSADRRAGCTGEACEGATWVVSLGSQQFTVLGLAGRWTELDQRANVRHFPDKARGFMQWYYYHGLLHYAGRMKPRDMCARIEAKVMREMTPHRVQTYTPFALTAKKLYHKCPTSVHPIIQAAWCSRHLPDASTGEKLLKTASGWLDVRHTLLHTMATKANDAPVANHHVRIGGLRGNLDCARNCSAHGGLDASSDVVVELDRLMLHTSPTNMLLFDSARASPAAALAAADGALQRRRKHPGRGKRPAAQTSSGRKMTRIDEPLCDGSGVSAACHHLLPYLKDELKLDHWQVATLVIDLDEQPGRSSLGVLMDLDLTYMRPKIVLVKLGPFSTSHAMDMATADAYAFLARNAMDATQVSGDHDPRCACAGVGTFCSCVWGTRINIAEIPSPKK